MSLLQIFCLKLLKHRNQVYVQFYTDFPFLLENLNTKSNGDIASVTSFRLGFNTSNVLNTSKIKDKKIVYVTIRSDNMHISTQLPKNISRAMLVHGTNARTAILSIEETGFWLYGDITGITGIFLAEYIYS